VANAGQIDRQKAVLPPEHSTVKLGEQGTGFFVCDVSFDTTMGFYCLKLADITAEKIHVCANNDCVITTNKVAEKRAPSMIIVLVPKCWRVRQNMHCMER
jgi:hypothetical protein